MIACEKTQRRARLIELDPKYVDVIVKRWQEFTGKEATLASNGQSFNDLIQERLKQFCLQYTFFMQGDDTRFDKNMDYHKRFTRKWDEPEIDENLDCTKVYDFIEK